MTSRVPVFDLHCYLTFYFYQSKLGIKFVDACLGQSILINISFILWISSCILLSYATNFEIVHHLT